MSKILILPDVHNRHEKAEQIIKSVKPDQTILLGDYFDDFGDDPHSITETAEWFHYSVNQSARIHICGNHDLHYWFKNNSGLRCSGYEQFKAIAINDFVRKEDWEKLVFFHVLNDRWLLSHGGVHPSWINPENFQATKIAEYTLKYVVRKLTNDSVDCKRNLYVGKHHWFAMPGFSRSSSPYYGGITWCDWNKEFHPIRGINQLVGHTPNYHLNWSNVAAGGTRAECLYIGNSGFVFEDALLSNDASFNLCLDSQPGSRYYAIYENEKLEIIDTGETKK